MPFELWLAYAAVVVVLLVIPGPTILTVISYSVAHGGRANVPLVAAVALGDSTALAMATVNAALYAVFAGSARRLLASAGAQRRFHVAGGSLLSLAGVWALLARRVA